MRTTDETIAEIMEQAAGAGAIRSRKMMGEYVLYCDDKVVGVVCENELYVKFTDQCRAFAPDLELLPAYQGAKPGLHVPADRRADTVWLAELIQTTADALPAKTKK